MRFGPRLRRQGSLLPISGHNDRNPTTKERPIPDMAVLLERAKQHMALRIGQRAAKACRCHGKCQCQ